MPHLHMAGIERRDVRVELYAGEPLLPHWAMVRWLEERVRGGRAQGRHAHAQIVDFEDRSIAWYRKHLRIRLSPGDCPGLVSMSFSRS